LAPTDVVHNPPQKLVGLPGSSATANRHNRFVGTGPGSSLKLDVGDGYALGLVLELTSGLGLDLSLRLGLGSARQHMVMAIRINK
jgi:hypothetical protein